MSTSSPREADRSAVSVTGWGLNCALGTDPAAVHDQLAAGVLGLQDCIWLAGLAPGLAGVASPPQLRPWLQRRKDAKLLARPSALLLPACGQALADFAGDHSPLGAWLGVGQEPTDDGASEAALVASAHDGRLDEQRLATVGRDRYPPLLPLRTLPNMALAHVSIHLGVGGSNGVWAGGPEAGLVAARAGILALNEGRAPMGLVGATDSLIDLASARDQRRLGHSDAPGEAAVALLIASAGHPDARCEMALWDLDVDLDEDPDEDPDQDPDDYPDVLAAARARTIAHRPALGRCGAADGTLALLLACLRVEAGGPPELIAAGNPAVVLRIAAAGT